MKNRNAWIRGEIEAWQREGLIPSALADCLLARYPVTAPGSRSALQIGFAVLGALLIGGGIILLLAHNWADLSRPMRTAIALAPLLMAQILALFGAARGWIAAGWREGVGVFWTLSIGAAVALVSQIYHLSGSYDSFMLTWVLLALPVVYVMRSAIAATLYLAGVLSWCASVIEEEWPIALGVWPMIAAVVPFLLRASRRGVFTPGLALMRWAVTVAVIAAVSMTLAGEMTGLWVPLFGTLFSLFWLVDERFLRHAPSWRHRPMRIAGTAGFVLWALILTFEWPWREIAHAESVWMNSEARVVAAGAALLAMMGVAMVLLIGARTRLSGPDWIPAAGFLAIFAAYAGVAQVGADSLVPLSFSALVFAQGLLVVMRAMRRESMSGVNAGLALLAAVLGLRFFDSDLPLVARGLAFVAIGSAFLAANAVLSRRLRRRA